MRKKTTAEALVTSDSDKPTKSLFDPKCPGRFRRSFMTGSLVTFPCKHDDSLVRSQRLTLFFFGWNCLFSRKSTTKWFSQSFIQAKVRPFSFLLVDIACSQLQLLSLYHPSGRESGAPSSRFSVRHITWAGGVQHGCSIFVKRKIWKKKHVECFCSGQVAPQNGGLSKISFLFFSQPLKSSGSPKERWKMTWHGSNVLDPFAGQRNAR